MPAATKFHLVAENRKPMGGHRLGDSPRVIQALWRVCCQSIDEHRFDCPDVPPDKRGVGPCLPRAPMTPAQIIRRMRAECRAAAPRTRP